jgi:hypothetical protein
MLGTGLPAVERSAAKSSPPTPTPTPPSTPLDPDPDLALDPDPDLALDPDPDPRSSPRPLPYPTTNRGRLLGGSDSRTATTPSL